MDDSEELNTNRTGSEEDQGLEFRLKLLQQAVITEKNYLECLQISNKLVNSIKSKTSSTLLFSEIKSDYFLSLIEGLREFDVGFPEDACFLDLGCGSGVTLLIIGLLNIFKRAVGIEIIEGLVKKTNDSIKMYNDRYKTPADLTDFEVIQGDGTYYDWSYANLVYIQATCFDDAMMARIIQTAAKLKPSSVLITVNNKLLSDSCFDLIGIVPIEYSFGPATAFIYRKASIGNYCDVQRVRNNLEDVLKRKYVIG